MSESPAVHPCAPGASTAVAVATCLGAVLLGACGGTGATEAATPSVAPTAVASDPVGTSGAEPSVPVAPGPVEEVVALGPLTLALTPPDPADYRSRSSGGAQQWLPLDVVSDPTSQRWGDILLYVPELSIDPATRAEAPAPDDVAGWLAAHPRLEVLDARDVPTPSGPARQLDVRIPEPVGLLGATEAFGSGPDGTERFTVLTVDDTTVVVQAGTFRGVEGLAEEDAPDDPYARLVGSLRSAG
jgi:hypothetical protein